MANDTGTLLYKDLSVKGITTIDEEQGIVEAYVSGIGNRDSVNDIIQPGAFIDSLKRRTPKGVWSHNWDRPVSKTLEIREVPAGDASLPEKMKTAGIGGLYVKTQFNLDTQDGREAFSWVKFYGEDSEWSIGYQVDEQEWDKEQKANLLHKIDLFEYSPVLFGANPLTATVGVKASGGNVDVKVQGVDPEMSGKITEAVEKLLSDEEAEQEKVDGETLEAEEPEADETPEDGAEEPEAKESDASDEAEAKDETPEEAPEADATDPEEPEDEGAEPEEKTFVPSAAYSAVKALLDSSRITGLEAMGIAKMAKAAIEPEGKKSIPGSWEERQDMIEDALEEELVSDFSQYVWVYATFDNSVVYAFCDWMEDDDPSYFQASYSIGDDGSVTLGEPSPVDIVEVVVAKSAIVDAIMKGHGATVKELLKPFVEASVTAEPDVDVKAALEAVEAKAGATFSAANREKLQDAYDILATLLGVDVDSAAEQVIVEEAAAEDAEEKTIEVEIAEEMVELDPALLEEFRQLLND